MEDIEPGRSPPPLELVGMHFRSTRIGIVEIAPGENVYSADTCRKQRVRVSLQSVEGVEGHRCDDTPFTALSMSTIVTLDGSDRYALGGERDDEDPRFRRRSRRC